MVRAPLNCKSWLPPGHLGLLSRGQGVGRATSLTGASDPDQPPEEGILLHYKQEFVWNSGVCLAGFWCPYAIGAVNRQS